MNCHVKYLFIGTPKKTKTIKFETAIYKDPVDHIIVKRDKIIGDQVANLKYHGGLNRVLHQYPIENYHYWSKTLGSDLFVPGAFGENLTSFGMLEKDVCIGDIFQIGEVECILTEPRKPCGTINLKVNEKGMLKHIKNEKKTGWFYRILKPGNIRKGDEVKLVNRDYPDLTVEKCITAVLLNGEKDILSKMSQNPILSDAWKSSALKLI